MKSLLLCTLFVGLASARNVTLRQTTCECGWTNTGRIVGGKETKPNEYPWMVALSGRKGLFCGGSIITPYHVLTAAHCGEFYPASRINIIVGAHDLGGRTQSVPASKIVIHEGWDPYYGSLNNDISIVVTAKEIQFTKTIGPVCMPTSPLQPALNNKFIKVTGWGLTVLHGNPTDLLREVDLQVTPRKECQKYWPELDNKICAISVQKSTCHGDSGGPFVWLDPSTNRYTQVALVSYGENCKGPKPTVNTDVSAYIGWINKVIERTKVGAKTCSAARKH